MMVYLRLAASLFAFSGTCIPDAPAPAQSLAALLKDRKTLLLGLPGGKVCEEQHFPDYQKSFPSLKVRGCAHQSRACCWRFAKRP